MNHFEGVARVDARVDATLGAAAAAAGAAQGGGAAAAGTLAAGDAGTTWDSAAGGDEVVGAVADVLSDILAASSEAFIHTSAIAAVLAVRGICDADVRRALAVLEMRGSILVGGGKVRFV